MQRLLNLFLIIFSFKFCIFIGESFSCSIYKKFSFYKPCGLSIPGVPILCSNSFFFLWICGSASIRDLYWIYFYLNVFFFKYIQIWMYWSEYIPDFYIIPVTLQRFPDRLSICSVSQKSFEIVCLPILFNHPVDTELLKFILRSSLLWFLLLISYLNCMNYMLIIHFNRIGCEYDFVPIACFLFTHLR